MKSRSFRFLISALAIAGLVVFPSCNKDELTPGIDKNLPGTEGLAYDEVNSSSTIISLTWNADKAIAAGAKSFTVQLTKSLTLGGDVYATTSQTFSVSDDGINNAVMFSSLKSGDRYYARARANYPGSRMSDWVYVCKPDSVNVPAVLMVGTGIYSGPITTITKASAKLIKATSSSLGIAFSTTDFSDYATDITHSYDIALYKDEACSDLVVSWLAQNAGTGSNASLKWTDVDGARFIFAGLSSNTTYYFKVSDTTLGYESTSKVIPVKTLAYDIVAVSENPAAAGAVILSEDFSQFPWGGTLADNENCPGYSRLDRSKVTTLDAATGQNPVSTDGTTGNYLCATGQNMGLFNTLGAAIGSTRLDTWGYVTEEKTAGNPASGIGALCVMPGCLQLGASSLTAQIVTPELNCLTSTATIIATFDVQAESTDPNRDFFIDVIAKSSSDNHCITYDAADCVNVIDSVYSDNTKMLTKTVTIPNVPVGARIAFGGRRVSGTSGQQRFFFDNLKLTVKSYGSTHVDIATPVIAITAGSDNIIASWDAAKNASAYVVEYKKTSDADWTKAGSTSDLSYKITGLTEKTSYDVRVKGISGESESAYSEVKTIETTEAPKSVSLKTVVLNESQIGLQWSISDFADQATDRADEYKVGVYTDAACTDLKYQWSFASDSPKFQWGSKGTYVYEPGLILSGFASETTYYVKVSDVTKNISAIGTYKTTKSKIVTVPAESAKAGDIVLFEDFSQFHYGADSPDCLPGYTSSKRSTASEMFEPVGETPETDADKGLSLTTADTHMGLFNTLKYYVPSTRLKDWSAYVEANNSGSMCIESGCLKIGASKTTGDIVTPALTCLSGTATLEVQFDAAPYVEGDVSAEDPLTTVIEYFPSTATTTSTYWIDYTNSANAPAGTVEISLDANPAWKHYTVTLPNVPAGSHVGIGPKIADKLNSQHRMYLDNIQIKVLSY